MKIFIANQSKQGIGGGWTFLRNFEKYANRTPGIQVMLGDHVRVWPEADIFFIAGATMVQRDEVEEAKRLGMKVVLRVDNAPRNSRNRNTGTSRLKDFADLADLIIYQSDWAKEYLAPFLGQEGKKRESVIMNGADHEIFKPDGDRQPKEGVTQYLFAQYNRDETKRWHEAWYEYSMYSRETHGSHLWIIGNFSPEQREYNFDFFMGEKFEYVGVLENPEDFAEYLRSTDILLIPYYNDACSNTLIEARLCGVPGYKISETGGNKQIMDAPLEHLKADFMTAAYLKEFETLL